jgi:hypothetical protein
MGSWTAILWAMLLSASAVGQQTPPVVVLPDSRAGAPQAASPAYTLQPTEKEPRSARLLQVQLGGGDFANPNPFQVRQGSYKFSGSELPRLVATSPEALSLAQQANGKFGLATGLLVGGLVTSLGALGTGIAALATLPQNNLNQLSSTTAVLLGTTLGLCLVSLAFSIGGQVVARDATDKWLDAVNTYNRQLVDGRLDPVPSS